MQDILNKRVDLVVDGSLLPFAIESAEKDKVLIYERARNQLARMGKQRIDCV